MKNKQIKTFENFNSDNTVTTERLQDFFEKEDFQVHLFEQDNEQCGEVEKWTDRGVDMIFSL